VRRVSIDQAREAIEGSWSVETCDPVDAPEWSLNNSARGQCGSTALVLNDIFGGELLVAEVLRHDQSRQGNHYWNRLPDGREIDLTRQQFTEDEVVQPPRRVSRPTGPPRRCAEQYDLLRERVFEVLGLGLP
jgi:hypothetical protein